MLILEVFIPSMGVLPVLCLGTFAASLWSAFSISLNTGLFFLMLDLAFIPVFIMVGASLWPHTPLAKLFTLKPPNERESFKEKLQNQMTAGANEDLQRYVGSAGLTITPLRPGGLIQVSGRPMDAVTDDGYIEMDRKIRVIGVRQSQLLVRIDESLDSQT
ncbi:MAG: hypothetical protein RJA81_1115 [Planctomycetota bacterium]